MAERCYIHGPTTTAGTCPTCDAMQRDARDAEITRIRARLAEAEAVIKPFAEEAIRYAPDEGDGDDVLWDKTGWLRIKHLRAAARWMEGKQ